MRRKHLKRAIRDFSHKTNFYELGLIRKLLLKRHKEKLKCIEDIPTIRCPKCNSDKISLEKSEDEYNNYFWFYCEKCDHEFEDEFDYHQSIEKFNYLPWTYLVEIELHFEKPNLESIEWKNNCRNLILEELNLKEN